MPNQIYPIEEAAKKLGRKLCGAVSYVVGTSITRKNGNLILRVDLDTDVVSELQKILPQIPENQDGFEVNVRLGGTSRFA